MVLLDEINIALRYNYLDVNDVVDFLKTRKPEDTIQFVRSIVESPVANRDYIFVIHYENSFVGLIGLKGIDNLNRRTEIGYWLSEPFQKKGIVTKAVEVLIDFAFQELNINRIQIKCATENFRSKKIPQRLGFRLEGIERAGELLTGGYFTDLEVYSKLRTD